MIIMYLSARVNFCLNLLPYKDDAANIFFKLKF